MDTTVVRVSDALLFHRHLGKSAKVLWMVLQTMRSGETATLPRTGLLLARTGLSRHTVLRALYELRTWGWLPSGPRPAEAPGQGGTSRQAIAPQQDTTPQQPSTLQQDTRPQQPPTPHQTTRPQQPSTPHQTTRPQQPSTLHLNTTTPPPADAAVPTDLLLDRNLSPQAKLLYAILQRTPGRQNGRGQVTFIQLTTQSGTSPNTVKRAIRALQASGWLEISQKTKFSPLQFLLGKPTISRHQERLSQMVRRLIAGPFRGEALMRAYLTLLVDSDEHDDDASPAFLVNPFTREEMQLDRYYARTAAFEHNGPQHYSTTERYPDEIALLKLQARDYMKQLICKARGIPLVIVHAEDLSLEGMRAKVAGLLPLRDLAGYEAVITHLEKVSRSYRQRAQKGHLWSA